MNRRNLLKLLAGSVATLAVGELLLPKRTIFLPPRGGWRPWDGQLAGWEDWKRAPFIYGMYFDDVAEPFPPWLYSPPMPDRYMNAHIRFDQGDGLGLRDRWIVRNGVLMYDSEA